MKKQIALGTLLAVSALAATAQTPRPAAPKAAPQKAMPAKKALSDDAPHELPADAKEISPNTYRWVDKKGAAWIYQKTPFGIAHAREKDTPGAQVAARRPAPGEAPNTIPAGAKEVSTGTYRWVDSKGVAWIYQRTPFGVMKSVEKNVPPPDPANISVREEGDTLYFEMPFPFGGVQKWTKKKGETLTDDEAFAVKAAQQKQQ